MLLKSHEWEYISERGRRTPVEFTSPSENITFKDVYEDKIVIWAHEKETFALDPTAKVTKAMIGYVWEK